MKLRKRRVIASLLLMSFMNMAFAPMVMADQQVLNQIDGKYGANLRDITGASIDTNGVYANITNTQTNSVLNWNTLNTAPGQTLNYNMVNGQTSFNQVVGRAPSTFAGNLTSTGGRLIIANPYGMIFENGSYTNVNSLILTTHDAVFNATNGKLDLNATKGGTIRIGGKELTQTNNAAVMRIANDLNIISNGIKVENADILAGNTRLVTTDGVNFVTVTSAPDITKETNNKAATFNAKDFDNKNISSSILVKDSAIAVKDNKTGRIYLIAKGNKANTAVLNSALNGKVSAQVDGDATFNVIGNLDIENATIGGNLVAKTVDGNINLKNSTSATASANGETVEQYMMKNGYTSQVNYPIARTAYKWEWKGIGSKTDKPDYTPTKAGIEANPNKKFGITIGYWESVSYTTYDDNYKNEITVADVQKLFKGLSTSDAEKFLKNNLNDTYKVYTDTTTINTNTLAQGQGFVSINNATVGGDLTAKGAGVNISGVGAKNFTTDSINGTAVKYAINDGAFKISESVKTANYTSVAEYQQIYINDSKAPVNATYHRELGDGIIGGYWEYTDASGKTIRVTDSEFTGNINKITALISKKQVTIVDNIKSETIAAHIEKNYSTADSTKNTIKAMTFNGANATSPITTGAINFNGGQGTSLKANAKKNIDLKYFSFSGDTVLNAVNDIVIDGGNRNNLTATSKGNLSTNSENIKITNFYAGDVILNANNNIDTQYFSSGSVQATAKTVNMKNGGFNSIKAAAADISLDNVNALKNSELKATNNIDFKNATIDSSTLDAQGNIITTNASINKSKLSGKNIEIGYKNSEINESTLTAQEKITTNINLNNSTLTAKNVRAKVNGIKKSTLNADNISISKRLGVSVSDSTLNGNTKIEASEGAVNVLSSTIQGATTIIGKSANVTDSNTSAITINATDDVNVLGATIQGNLNIDGAQNVTISSTTSAPDASAQTIADLAESQTAVTDYNATRYTSADFENKYQMAKLNKYGEDQRISYISGDANISNVSNIDIINSAIVGDLNETNYSGESNLITSYVGGAFNPDRVSTPNGSNETSVYQSYIGQYTPVYMLPEDDSSAYSNENDKRRFGEELDTVFRRQFTARGFATSDDEIQARMSAVKSSAKSGNGNSIVLTQQFIAD